jgi:hypothetical protein
MAEPNPVQEVPDAVPVAACVLPVPRTVEEALIDCEFASLQADRAIDQGL